MKLHVTYTPLGAAGKSTKRNSNSNGRKSKLHTPKDYAKLCLKKGNHGVKGVQWERQNPRTLN